MSLPTTTLERVEVPVAQTDQGDGTPRYAHIVYPKSALADAMVFGTPVTALCGHTWVPGRDPRAYPLCSRCKEAMEALHGEGSSPDE
jgi:hypothetical protein